MTTTYDKEKRAITRSATWVRLQVTDNIIYLGQNSHLNHTTRNRNPSTKWDPSCVQNFSVAACHESLNLCIRNAYHPQRLSQVMQAYCCIQNLGMVDHWIKGFWTRTTTFKNWMAIQKLISTSVYWLHTKVYYPQIPSQVMQPPSQTKLWNGGQPEKTQNETFR